MNYQQQRKDIEIKSLRERLLLQEYLETKNVTTVEYSPYKGNDGWDAKWLDLEIFESVLCEAKVRISGEISKNYDGYIIERKKYDELMKNKTIYDKILYINFFSNGYVVWDLKQMEEPKWITKNLAKNNQEEYEIEKQQADLMRSDAIEVKIKDLQIYLKLELATKIWKKRNNITD